VTVLILAGDIDPTADAMVTALTARNSEVFRLNTAWFPTQVRLTARTCGSGRWAGTLTTPHGTVDLREVDAVWYRSPEAYRMPEEMSPAEAAHARVEAKYGLGGVLASLPALWCNHPARVADAAYKPLQLVRAAACGLSVPDTLITNDAASVGGFAAELDGSLVTKLLGGMALSEQGVRKNVFTRRLAPGDLDDLAGVEHTSHLFQAWVPKECEARVICVGEHITAAAITAHCPSGYVDYRQAYSGLTYELIAVPAAVRAGIKQLMGQLRLSYGALDFVITPAGQWVFLETNPAGQYGWIENATGAPLTDQLADLLTGSGHD
jgi:ATP-grasp ribosomal peptide maturase